jgi:hypothetical protein
VRDLAERVDPFTRKRLLDLADATTPRAAPPPARVAGHRAAAAASPRGAGLRTVWRGMKKAEPIEVRCDACGGTGHPPVRQPRPGRRIYPAPCKKCGGKGRVVPNS